MKYAKMKVLVTGGAKNGKSCIAQNLCRRLSACGRRFYIATMLPSDAEDILRIKQHVSDRKGLGFETVECARNILDSFVPAMQYVRNCVLVDSLTALLANEMFADEMNCNCAAPQKVSDELAFFAGKVGNAIFVSDGIFSDSVQYGTMTDAYRKGLALCEQTLARVCDAVIEMVAGIPVVHKGKMEMNGSEALTEKSFAKNINLIVGGAHQGKLSYARDLYGLSESDISLCSRNAPPDFSKRCIAHAENYVWYCLKNSISPCSDFPAGTIVIADDIFCGVVPMDAFERKWRETCGMYLQKLAKRSCVTRIVCGIPQILQ